MKKSVKIISIVVVIIAIIIYNSYSKNKENSTSENAEEKQNSDKVDLFELKDYIGDAINNDKALELLNKIKNEYKMYLANLTANEDGTGIYIYFSSNIKTNIEEIKNNAIISMINDYISNREQDKDRGYYDISTGVDNQDRQFIYFNKKNKIIEDGIITNIDNNTITIKNEEINYLYQVKISEDSKIINYRTTENMNLSDIKIGDYYSSGKVIRNISGDEWKKECIKNLAYCYDGDGALICNPMGITNIENMETYVIITLIMEDSTTKYFNEKGYKNTFELKAIANSNTKIPTITGGVTIYNLKEETDSFMFWIELDKNTINNKYPTISIVDIYDK